MCRVRSRLLDVLGGLEAVHAGHVGVEQDHRVVVDQQLLERVLAAADGDDLDGQPLEDRLQRQQVLPAVVDGQHLAAGRRVIGASPRGGTARRAPTMAISRQQLVEVDGLGDVVGGPGREAALPVAGHRLRGEEHHRQVAALRQRADPPGGLVAVEVGHHRVHQHDVDLGVVGEQPRSRRRRCRRRARAARAAPARWSARTRCARRRRRSARWCPRSAGTGRSPWRVSGTDAADTADTGRSAGIGSPERRAAARNAGVPAGDVARRGVGQVAG